MIHSDFRHPTHALRETALSCDEVADRLAAYITEAREIVTAARTEKIARAVWLGRLDGLETSLKHAQTAGKFSTRQERLTANDRLRHVDEMFARWRIRRQL